MRKRFSCAPKKCMIAITAASISMSIAAGLIAAPIVAYAENYDLVNGSVNVNSDENGERTVTQDTNTHNETTETVITCSDAGGTSNTISIESHGEGENAAKVTIENVNIDTESSGGAAISTSGNGDVVIEINGTNTVQSGDNHAGIEKGNDGNLTIQNEEITSGDKLTATGGENGAGIGGGQRYVNNPATGGGFSMTTIDGSANDITISGGDITATGGKYAAGIGGGYNGDADHITISGGDIIATGGLTGAGIGGGYEGTASEIIISGSATVSAAGGSGGNENLTIAPIGGAGTSFSITYGAGAAIGNGSHGTMQSGQTPAPGTPVEPDTSALYTSGKINIYPVGTTADDIENNRVAPISTTEGTITPPSTGTGSGEGTGTPTTPPSAPTNTASPGSTTIPEQITEPTSQTHVSSDHSSNAGAPNNVAAPQTGAMNATIITDMINTVFRKNPNADSIDLDFGKNICFSPALMRALYEKPNVAKNCRFIHNGEVYILHIPKADTGSTKFETCLDTLSKEPKGFAGFMRINQIFSEMGTTISKE
ncbi:hypothetical protein D6856_14990 [Butyrivibrio sp. XB500-5]|uniref:hypothetical protein n=1 Tax=Butyrivibrio sp. XB500-5 TaxID=2364880 RepID=UPI000EA99D0E|nr:hypothetical protein [Butyrivibrio sp. XB500-5]RKM56041.1 hypothetical protein D6856_14990 [Butyrivibrio sp. XB500-5]